MQTKQNFPVRLLASIILLAGLARAIAQPTLISSVPANGASGVAPGASVVFTFNTAMDTNLTAASFNDVTGGFESPPVISTWNASNTVLTCKPSPPFANNHNIQWEVNGQDKLGNFFAGGSGNFTTVAGVNGGSGTNAFTTFIVGKYDFFEQTTNASATFFFHEFFAASVLASNRTATNATVTAPSTFGTTNLERDLLQPEQFNVDVTSINVTNISTNFPAGNYVFNVRSISSNQQVTVNLPNYAQPNSPQVTNYTAAQSVDPTQPFTVGWNIFTNGTSADLILLGVEGDDGFTVFQTPGPGEGAGLSGTARSVTIPAGTLAPNSTNISSLIFYHLTTLTNGGSISFAFVASATYFNIITTASAPAGPAPMLSIVPVGTNVVVKWPTNAVGYTLQFATNLPAASWSSSLPAAFVVNANQVVTNGISGARRYYRLIK